MGQYITPDGAKALKAYQYKGGDMSYIYRYILTPMNKRLVEFLPMWLAPNLVTMLGLIATTSAYALTAYHNPLFDAEMPDWVHIYVVVAMFAYQTLDNLDGRQARRTGSSSPLGLLFDHGVDSVNITMSTLTITSCWRASPGAQLLLYWNIAGAPFFFATWEEYFTDELILPEVNGPSDGVIISQIFCMLPVFLGKDLYVRPLASTFAFLPWSTSLLAPYATWNTNWAIAVAGIPLAILTCITNIQHVVTKMHQVAAPAAGGGKAAAVDKNPAHVSLPRAFLTLFPFIAQRVLAQLVFAYSPSDLVSNHPRLFLAGMGFLFSNCAQKLMMAHLCQQYYKPLRLVLLPLLAQVLNCAAPTLWPERFPEPPVAEMTLAIGVTVFSALTFAHYVLYAVKEITTILDINVFTIKVKAAEGEPADNAGGAVAHLREQAIADKKKK